MKPNITATDGCKIKIASFETQGTGKISQKTIDLTPYAGRTVRVWLDSDGKYSLDPRKDHYWQVAEIKVPEVEYREIEAEDPETGEMRAAVEALPMDLSGMDILVFDLPGAENLGQPGKVKL